VKGTFLEKPENRKTVTIAMNLLFGAAVLSRIHLLQAQGVPLPLEIGIHKPMRLSTIQKFINN